MELRRQGRSDVEKLQAVFQRPLECPGGRPMNHEDVRRKRNGLPIYSEGNEGNEYHFVDECTEMHARCPHKDKELWGRVVDLLREVLEEIPKKEKGSWREELMLLQEWNTGEIEKRIKEMDPDLRIARTGAILEEILHSEGIPSVAQANENAAPLEEEWRTLIAQSEAGRLRILAMLKAVLAADDAESSR